MKVWGLSLSRGENVCVGISVAGEERDLKKLKHRKFPGWEETLLMGKDRGKEAIVLPPKNAGGKKRGGNS